jgi:transposase-like protein
MTFTKGQRRIESSLTQADRERIWELFFGQRYSIGRIAREYDTRDEQIVRAIDSESEKRWRRNHPHETNREPLLAK